MTALELFGAVLLLIPSTAAGVALLVLVLAVTGLALGLGMPLRTQLDEASRHLADRAALGLGLTLLVVLGLGLRLEPTAHLAGGDMPVLRALATVLSSLGLAGLGSALVFIAVARAHRLPSARPVQRMEGNSAGRRRLKNAVRALHTVQDAVQKLEHTHAEASAHARDEKDPAVVRSYTQTAEVIAGKLETARTLVSTATRAVLRLSCQTALQDVLERRPDGVIAEVSQQAPGGAAADRVLQCALAELSRYIDRLQAAQCKVRDEVTGGTGSVAREFGTVAGDEVHAIAQAIDEMLGSYQRAWHQLQALDLRRQADRGASRAVAAASSLSAQGSQAPEHHVTRALALEIVSTEAAAERALSLAQDSGGDLGEAVQKASALLDGDDEELRDVLRSMREVSEQLGRERG